MELGSGIFWVKRRSVDTLSDSNDCTPTGKLSQLYGWDTNFFGHFRGDQAIV
jgi:hypothetical protein